MEIDIANLIAQVGTINPPPTIPDPGGNPTVFLATLIRASLGLLLRIGFVAFFFWTMFAGFRFVTSGGDPKTTGAAWSQIYWGIIGMMVILGSFAIIKLVERFFGVDLISGGLSIPQLP